MVKVLFSANYVNDGVKGLLKEGGSSRKEAVTKLFASLGGRVESFYYAFGDYDLYVICDMPDHASAAAFSLIVRSTGAIEIKATVLMAPEEIDEAAKKSPSYRAPGQ